VVSIYGDTYPSNIATNYNPNWGQSGFGTVNPNFNPGTGNSILAYTNFNYQGTLLTSTNLSSMEYLRFDVWTPANPSSTTLQVSPINQGTGTAEFLVTVPYIQGQWTSISLPKSAFVGMTWDAVFQLKFAANGPGSTVPVNVYLDNIYFSGDCQVCETVEGTDEISSCAPITWIDGNTYSSSNNTATHLLPGAAQNGCDSLVTLDFTLWSCTQLNAAACGSTNVNLDQALFAGLVGAPAYRFKISGNNNTSWNNNELIIDRNVRWFKFTPQVSGAIPGTMYNIEVAVGDGAGNFGPYSNSCNVTLNNNLPTTQLNAASCGAINVEPSMSLFANQVFDAQGYRFRISGNNTGAQGWVNNQFILVRTERWFKFAPHVPGFLSGETYGIEVAVLLNDGVTYGPYASLCEVTLSGTPNLVLDENEISMSDKSLVEVVFEVNASHNPFTTQFGIEVLNANDSEIINVVIYDMSGKLIERHEVTPMDIESAKFGMNLAAGMYMVEVKQGANQTVIRQVKN
jgi:hypothetical protein